MYLVLGITGHVGGSAARHLLEQGKRVRAMVRDETKAAAWSARGVELMKGEWQDSVALVKALEGVTGAYLMMPPTQAPSKDFREAKAVISSYQWALSKVLPSKLVVLSSMGSEKPDKLGAITATHLLEGALWNIATPIAFVRAGSFYENLAYGLQSGQGGVLPVFWSPTERKIPAVATEDIGAEVAKLLTTEWTGRRVIELGSMVSPNEIAHELGVVLGKQVKAQAIPREAWAPTLEGMGIPHGDTWAFEEMADSVNSGWIGFGVEGTERVEGSVTATQFFLAAQKALQK